MRPHIERAYAFLKAADHDGDGIPEGGSTWDVEHHPGLFSYTGSLWMATLRIVERIADMEYDDGRKREAAALFDKAQDSFIRYLWNGEYFAVSYEHTARVVEEGVFVGQLGGEWIVRLLGLPSILPQEMLQKALSAIYRYNGNQELYNLPPIKVAKDGKLTDHPLANQAWPQYAMIFVDCLALYLGEVEESLKRIQHFDEVVRTVAKAPWTTTLWHDASTGLPNWNSLDRYMNTPSAWFILNALTGFHADEVQNLILLDPHILARTTPRFGTLPLISTRWWGTVSMFHDNDDSTELCVKVDRLFGPVLKLKGFKLRGDIRVLSCDTNGRTVETTTAANSEFTMLQFTPVEGVSMAEGETIRFVITFNHETTSSSPIVPTCL